MAENYLRIAKQVLETRARPLTAQQILQDAHTYGLLPRHLSGKAMQKTLQARIAEDIYANRQASLFYRTKLGTYFLRHLASDVTLPPDAVRERDLSYRTVRFPKARILLARPPEDISEARILPNRYPVDSETTEYRYLWDIDNEHHLYTVLTMTFIFWNGMTLFHKEGKYSLFRDESQGMTAGFRRHVDEYDIDLFLDDPLGVDLSTLREFARVIGSGISLDQIDRQFVATCIDPVSRSLVYAVSMSIGSNSGYSGKLKRRLDTPQLRWASFQEIEDNLDHISAMLLSLASSA